MQFYSEWTCAPEEYVYVHTHSDVWAPLEMRDRETDRVTDRMRERWFLNELLSIPISRGGSLRFGSVYFSILGKQSVTQSTGQVALSLWPTCSSLDNWKMIGIYLDIVKTRTIYTENKTQKAQTSPDYPEIIIIIHFICLPNLFNTHICRTI